MENYAINFNNHYLLINRVLINNYLESKGWSVLRFTTENLTKNMDKTISVACDTINKYGGIQDETNEKDYHFIRPDDDSQLMLFD